MTYNAIIRTLRKSTTVAALLFCLLASSCYGQHESKQKKDENGTGQVASSTTMDETPVDEEQEIALPSSPVSLSTYHYEVIDTAEYVSFRLYVRNTSDSLVVLDRVEPSCVCILTTIQNRFARKEKAAEIYVAFATERIDEVRPYIVDVYTSANPESPMRLSILKKKSEETKED